MYERIVIYQWIFRLQRQDDEATFMIKNTHEICSLQIHSLQINTCVV